MNLLRSRPHFQSLEGFDPNLMDGRILEGAAARHSQVGGGRLSGELGAAPLAQCLINWWRIDNDMHVAGTAPSAFHSLLYVSDSPRPLRINEHAASQGDVVVYAPDMPLTSMMPGSLRLSSIAVPTDLFRSAILHPWRTAGAAWDGQVVVLRPEPGAASRLGQFLAEVQEHARGRADLFDDDAWRMNVEREALERFGAALASSAPAVSDELLTRRRSRALVEKVEKALADAGTATDAPRPSVSELCAFAGVSRRTLERAFEQMLGTSPADYVRALALNAARRDLLSAAAGATVTDAAISRGFWHFGRFSQQYRDLFGELPSETLRRASRPRSPDDGALPA